MKVFRLAVLIVVAAAMAGVAVEGAGATARRASGSLDKAAFCNKVQTGQIQVSSGARMFCFGAQPNGPKAAGTKPSAILSAPGLSNSDAATPQEDISPQSFVQAYGQSETAVAAQNQFGVEAWNDATGFFSAPCSPLYRDQLTGFGFTRNYGGSWTDMGGLPNVNCASSVFEGDPSVQPYVSGGTTYFYISSLYFGTGCAGGGLCVAIDQCHVSGFNLSCPGTPIVLADPYGIPLEDKDFMAVDPIRHRLYITYTDFGAPSGDEIVLSTCDLTTPATPTCYAHHVAIANAVDCAELEGSYPAVDMANGDVYVSFEYNWATNIAGCLEPTLGFVLHVPAACLTLPVASCGPNTGNAVPIASMDAAFIPGYNRFPMNDFPRIAVSDTAGSGPGSVAIVWNDARFHANGDILMQRFDRGSLNFQGPTTVVNQDTSGAVHILPAIGTSGGGPYGSYQVSWYDRRNFGPNSANTDVFSLLGAAGPTAHEIQVTNQASDWSAVNSDIVPNFGDYTDLYVAGNNNALFPHRVWYAWSDGRLGFPQPFSATKPIK